MSVSSAGAQGDQRSGNIGPLGISADGKYVVFDSDATNLVDGDTNNLTDIFVRDRISGLTLRVSVSSDGTESNGISQEAAISADGRYVAFDSGASNLVAGDTNLSIDIFVHDLQTGATERASVSTSGAQANTHCYNPKLSADGRFVVFWSESSSLVPGDTNSRRDVFLRDRQNGTTTRVSLDSNGLQVGGDSELPSISADGRFVAFESVANSFVSGDTNAFQDIFVRDTILGVTERVSVASDGTQANGDCFNACISGDGRYVLLSTTSSTLVAGDSNGAWDAFLHDRITGTTEIVSVNTSGIEGNNLSSGTSLSDDGRFVGFISDANNLVSGDTNGRRDMFVHDRLAGFTERVSLSATGVEGNLDSDASQLSGDGRFVLYASRASNLVAGDTNAVSDVFLGDRSTSGFTSLCDPGTAGVRACPCGNPPSGSGRGCDNSTGTGGAVLSASGVAYLSMDSLVFTATGVNQTALGLLLQGNGVISTGAVYGQGVRCVGGTIIRRLYTKSALGGIIRAPDLTVGDPTVAGRSAALGDFILPGETRWYLVYYRDPNVLAGCPASSTFNATQTGRIDWQP